MYQSRQLCKRKDALSPLDGLVTSMGYSDFTSLQKWLLLIFAAAILALGIYEMHPGRRLGAKQAALLEWAQSGSPSAFRDTFAAPDYSDQWGQSAADVVGRMRMVRFSYPGVTVTTENPEISRDGDTAQIRQQLEISGADSPRAAMFTFRWKRQNWLPWSWRLERLDAPELEL